MATMDIGSNVLTSVSVTVCLPLYTYTTVARRKVPAFTNRATISRESLPCLLLSPSLSHFCPPRVEFKLMSLISYLYCRINKRTVFGSWVEKLNDDARRGSSCPHHLGNGECQGYQVSLPPRSVSVGMLY